MIELLRNSFIDDLFFDIVSNITHNLCQEGQQKEPTA
jgi:hypothetical protein